MAITALQLVTGSMRLIGALSSGESPSTEEQADCLSALNQLLASWSDMGLLIPEIKLDSITLTGVGAYDLPTPRPIKIKAASVTATTTASLPLIVADAVQWAAFLQKGPTDTTFGRMLFYSEGYPLGSIFIAPHPGAGAKLELVSLKAVGSGPITVRDQFTLTSAASWTIGTGGTLDAERPVKILSASVSASAKISKVLNIATAEVWAAFPDKESPSDFAEILYCDNAYPTSHVNVAPRPATGTLEIYSYKPLLNVATIATSIDLPPGYERALRFNLAVDIASEFGFPINDSLAAGAKESKENLAGLMTSVLGPPIAATGPNPPVQQVPVPVPANAVPPGGPA